MRVIVIGVGAMGCLFGARLATVAEVALLGSWPAQVRAITESGLHLIEPDGTEIVAHLRVNDDVAQVKPADLVLVLVKSYQTRAAARVAAQAVSAAGCVLTLQNGWGNREQIAEAVGTDRTYLGTTTEGATVVKPGVVRHAGKGETYLGGTALAPVAELFEKAGFTTRLVDQVEGLLWGKLAVNAAINPLTALLRKPNGFLLENRAARNLMFAAAAEAADVARAQEIDLPFEDAGAEAERVARNTARNHSSMLQDVLNGRPTEREAICGAVVKLGNEHDVPTPTNALLMTLMDACGIG